jgi:hypothetical protein
MARGFGRGSRRAAGTDTFRPNGRVRTAAGGTRNRGGALALATAPQRPSSLFDPARALGRQALARQQQPLAGGNTGELSSASPWDSSQGLGGNTGAKKGADKSSGAGSKAAGTVYRRARPGEFSQRARGGLARARVRRAARTGTGRLGERARAIAAQVGIRV